MCQLISSRADGRFFGLGVVWMLLLLGTATLGRPLQAATQQLSAEPAAQMAAPAASLQVAARYASLPNATALTGLGLRVHWDSSALALSAVESSFAADQVGLDSGCLDDRSTDYDQDPNTDCYALIAWASLDGDWAADQPQTLLTLRFENRMSGDAQTQVAFSSAGTAAGYDFASTLALISNERPDGDGDGVPDDEDPFPDDPDEWADEDGDGVGDNADNCPDVSNPGQADQDGDGIGDACDETTFCEPCLPGRGGWRAILGRSDP
ncbi:MAG: hypothetical protein C1943_08905 [Halochromatium sp.]|nr:hypothetical protein [Halochromatium sp.]